MCGITGFLDTTRSTSPENLQSQVTGMMDAISHRGPDDQGTWLDPASGLALGFRRLAILDLSPNGHQPMSSADERYVIVYNGEVYNFQAIRDSLTAKGHSFRGGSDTEVMLASFREWGIPEAIKQFNGMFAIAVWDKKDELLYLVRDRIGVKPLYYGWQGGLFYFGSELKALRSHPHFQPTLDREALAQYFKFGYIPTPLSIYQDINKLEPASILVVDPKKPGVLPGLERYWHLPNSQSNGHVKRDEGETLAELEALLLESVRLRMIADVPLGAFLSGGVDSSTVVALMQAQSSQPVKTFTIGFNEDQFNEANHAKRVASHLGTDHTELILTATEAMAVIPKIPHIYDEPFADSSQIPTYLVSELASRHVTVSLSGDGGDELFLGYNRYLWAQKIWNTVGWLPKSSKQILARTISSVPISKWDGLMRQFAVILPSRARYAQFGDKLQKMAVILKENNPGRVYDRLVTFWPASLVVGNPNGHTIETFDTADSKTFLQWMSITDIHTYLPDDILVKVDRASMAASLEARVPLLDDHRVVEFAMKLPVSLKIRAGKSKWALRQILYKYVPQELIERPKMGFGVPIDSWLRGPMREWAGDLLAPSRIRSQGFLASAPIEEKWGEHLSGTRNWQYHLWSVLMFQSWLETSQLA